MNHHATGSDEYDPLQAAAFTTIEQAAPFFDLSDDKDTDVGSTTSAHSPTKLKRHDLQLSSIQQSKVPFSVMDILPEGAQALRPATSQLATLDDFNAEFAHCTREKPFAMKSRTPEDCIRSKLPREPVLDEIFSRISTANGQRPRIRKGSRRQLLVALPALHSASSAKYQPQPQRKIQSQASRR